MEEQHIALTRAQIDSFWRDGVICIRKLYSESWLRRMEAFLDDIVSKPSPVLGPRNPSSKFHSDLNTWLTNDEVRDLVFYGPGASVAQQVFNSRRVTFYYDQIFVKEQLTPDPTPWHHDFTFWPLEGDQIASLWASVDPVDAESSALEFVAGSHRWPQRFRAIGADGTDFSSGEALEELPDIEADRTKFDIVSWELEPGDALLFHALTLHGARGNRSMSTKRRAIATRWCGDDVVYRSGKAMEFYRHELKDGDEFSAWVYPQVLPRLIDEQVCHRMAGPVLPDAKILNATLERASKLDRVEVPPDSGVSGLMQE